MIYQVTARMFFDSEDETKDFFHDCEIALSKAIVVNPGMPDQECSEAEYIQCHHDNHPPEPCNLNQHIDNCPEISDLGFSP